MAVFYAATTAIRSRFCGPLLLRVLQSLVQFAVRKLYDTIDQSPIYSVTMALDEVLKVTIEKTPDNTLTPNPYHVVEGHRFDFMVDYDHDLKLLTHHVQRLKVIIAEIEET